MPPAVAGLITSYVNSLLAIGYVTPRRFRLGVDCVSKTLLKETPIFVC